MILIYTTCKDRKEASRIADELLKKRAIACANMFPIKSMYRWKGKIEKDDEIALLCKTQEAKFDIASKTIKRMHSYDVPAVIKIKADADERYDSWIRRGLLGV